jgi:hypothetical protein
VDEIEGDVRQQCRLVDEIPASVSSLGRQLVFQMQT